MSSGLYCKASNPLHIEIVIHSMQQAPLAQIHKSSLLSLMPRRLGSDLSRTRMCHNSNVVQIQKADKDGRGSIAHTSTSQSAQARSCTKTRYRNRKSPELSLLAGSCGRKQKAET